MALLTYPDLRRIRFLTAIGVAISVLLFIRLAFFDFRAGSEAFHPHGYCYLWRRDLVAVNVIADALIGGAYTLISFALIYLVWRARMHLPFSWVFVAFGGFIVACGVTHFMEIWTLWKPVFWLSADVKVITAVASVATAILFPPLIPKILRGVEAAVVSEQRREALERVQSELEQRVGERTAQLQAALERAEEANRMKEVFLGTISHELRTPLTAIVGWSRMLTTGDVDAAFVRKGLAVIDRNARVQAQLIEDLLDVSRLGAGTLRLHTEVVDLTAILRDAVEVVRPSAAVRRVTLDVSLGGPLPLIGDARRLQQIAWNLLSNAVKFTPAGGTVSVRVARDGDRVLVDVRDTGVGIDPAFLPRVFERFSQHDPMSTRSRQGLGVGLAIAAQLAELHGGTIVASSPGQGKGSTFRLELPFRDDVSLKPRLRDEARANSLAGVRVLVVDDEPDARETLSVMLARAGATVVATDSAVTALERLRKERFDVLVSDLAMPGHDGYSLIEAVRRSDLDHVRHLPAIAISAPAQADARELALERGYQVHLGKPVSPEALANAVAAVVPR